MKDKDNLTFEKRIYYYYVTHGVVVVYVHSGHHMIVIETHKKLQASFVVKLRLILPATPLTHKKLFKIKISVVDKTADL